MPIYEYYCTKCGHEEELLQPMNADPPTCKICVELKEHATLKHLMQRKLSSIAPPIFKGSGFYTTDYKKKTKINLKKYIHICQIFYQKYVNNKN